ncbi:MAG: KamA family radical SAM protein, partial [bacterium]
MDVKKFTPENLKAGAPAFFAVARQARSLDTARERLAQMFQYMQYDTFEDYSGLEEGSIIRVRDCGQALRSMLTKRAEDLAEFSVTKAIRDVARNKPRPDLSPAFFADLTHIFLGLQGRGPGRDLADTYLTSTDLTGARAAKMRSRQLDFLWKDVQKHMERYQNGYSLKETVRYRENRRKKILKVLGAGEKDWFDWRWQINNIVRDAGLLSKMVRLTREEKIAVKKAHAEKLPFGITPYYLSLMDDHPAGRDRAVRAQVLPPIDYVHEVSEARGGNVSCLDFMGEEDTSPHDLITRRYPAICILKPFNTCPQICVYCQRNWEIDDAMMPGAHAGDEMIDRALKWIENHPALHEVLVTGGDPLAMEDHQIERLLDRLAKIPSVERIRIGSRTIATMPMRITKELAGLIARYRDPGRREVCVVTHVQHPY